MDSLVNILSQVYVTCRQIALIITYFPQGYIWIYEDNATTMQNIMGLKPTTAENVMGSNNNNYIPPHKQMFKNFATFRINLIIKLLYRIVDIHNMDVSINWCMYYLCYIFIH